MRRKGLIGMLAAVFAMGVFAALFLFIFLYAFKYHITMMMVDYYLWGKEYDIPLALLSIDIKNPSDEYESSIIVLNKIHYERDLEKKEEMSEKLREIIESWFPMVSESDYTREYTLSFGDADIVRKGECSCDLISSGVGECTEGCGPTAGNSCSFDRNCRPTENIIKMNQLGIYPLPIVFNGTDHVIKLEWESSVIRWVK